MHELTIAGLTKLEFTESTVSSTVSVAATFHANTTALGVPDATTLTRQRSV